MKYRRTSHGFAYVLTLILLSIMMTLAAALTSSAGLSLISSSNLSHAAQARLEAESGISYYTYKLARTSVPNGASGAALLSAVTAALPIAPGVEVNQSGLPGQSFSVSLSAWDQTLHLTSTGRCGGVTRTVSVDLNVAAGVSKAFDFGVASKGSIVLTGNANVSGVNNDAEGTMYSGTFTTGEAYKLTGNCSISGDVSAANPSAYATLTGNVSIGGESLWSGNISDHIHIGVDQIALPEPDPALFEPFATYMLAAGESTSGNKTFKNLRIPAGRNPTFSGNIVIQGVLFIEKPNRVQFSGNLNFTGVIVTQDAGDGVYASNTIKFTGNSTFLPVESLPDTPEFAGLRQLPGTFLLAPGFGAEFTGNFGTIGGTMAAEQFTWTGNASGVVKGCVLSYSDTPFSMAGNSHLRFDRAGGPATPPGFAVPLRLTIVASTYREY